MGNVGTAFPNSGKTVTMENIRAKARTKKSDRKSIKFGKIISSITLTKVSQYTYVGNCCSPVLFLVRYDVIFIHY